MVLEPPGKWFQLLFKFGADYVITLCQMWSSIRAKEVLTFWHKEHQRIICWSTSIKPQNKWPQKHPYKSTCGCWFFACLLTYILWHCTRFSLSKVAVAGIRRWSIQAVTNSELEANSAGAWWGICLDPITPIGPYSGRCQNWKRLCEYTLVDWNIYLASYSLFWVP